MESVFLWRWGYWILDTNKKWLYRKIGKLQVYYFFKAYTNIGVFKKQQGIIGRDWDCLKGNLIDVKNILWNSDQDHWKLILKIRAFYKNLLARRSRYYYKHSHTNYLLKISRHLSWKFYFSSEVYYIQLY